METAINLDVFREKAENSYNWTYVESEGADTVRFDDGEVSVWVYQWGDIEGDKRLVKVIKKILKTVS